MYNKTDFIDAASKTCVAAFRKNALPRTLRVRQGLGQEPQQARKNTRSVFTVRVFLQVVYTLALLAGYFMLSE